MPDLAALLAARDWPAAERALRRLAGAKGAGAPVFYSLGKVLLEMEKPQQALHWLGRAVAADPALQAAHFEQGRAAVAAGDLPLAARAFAAALDRDPADADAARNLGRVAERTGDHAAAARAWARLLALAPGDGEALCGAYVAAAEAGGGAAERAALLARADTRPEALKALIRTGRGALPLRLPPAAQAASRDR